MERQLRSSGEDSNSTGTTDWLIISLIPPNSSNLVPICDFSKDLKSKASVSTCHTQQIYHGVHETQKADTGLTAVSF